MGTWFRVIFLGLLAFALVGCNLETKEPVFADTDAKLLLAGYPNLAPYERDGGDWKKSTDPLSIKPEASHYLVRSGNSDMVISFVPLEGPWWILQAAEWGSLHLCASQGRAKGAADLLPRVQGAAGIRENSGVKLNSRIRAVLSKWGPTKWPCSKP